MTPQDQLIAWLNDAHAMERSLAKVLERHAKDAREFPEMQSRLEAHLLETERHADLVEQCLAILGRRPSVVKSAMGAMMGMAESRSTAGFRDEMVKNFLMDYTAEHFEIACYESLVAAANELGLQEIADICEGILVEEEEMALWLEERLPEVTSISLRELAAHP